MAPSVDISVPAVRELDEVEFRQFFDAKAQELMGVTGEEFLRRWRAGDYAEIADGPAHADFIYLVLLGTGGR